MGKTANIQSKLVISLRLYRALIAVYPPEFRQAYGDPMLQVFNDCCRRALLDAGMAGLLSLWWRTMLDTVKSAIEEHTQRGVYMMKSKFIKLSGWGLILGGLAFALGGIASMRPQYERYNAISLPIDQYANAVAVPLLAMGFLLISVGLIGLLLHYGQAAGSLGRYSLGLGAISGVISAASFSLLSAYDTAVLWLIFVFSVTFQFLGLVFFGVASLRKRTLPRWNGLPILAGIWIPIWALAGTIYEVVSDKWFELPPTISLATLLLMLTGLAGLGYLLQTDSQPADIATASV